MEESSIVGDLLKGNLYGKFIIESFLQNFHTPNTAQVIYHVDGLSERNGALSEAIVELDFMSRALNKIYELYIRQGSHSLNYLTPIFSYEYNSISNPNSKSVFIGPRMGISQKRSLDEGLRTFMVTIGSEQIRIGVLSPVKHTIRLDRWENLISDAISGAFINSRDNIDKGIILNSELFVYLHSLRYELQGLDLTEEAVRKWISTEYNNIKHKEGTIKVERQDVFESSIIKAINQEIWNLYGKELTREKIAQVMRDELTEPDFVQSKIINLNDFRDKQSFNLPLIITFIQNLAANIDSAYSKIGVILDSGSFEVRTGLSRTVQKSDYFVTKEILNYDQLLSMGIERIYTRMGTVQNLNQMDLNSLKNTFLEKQYRIVTKEDGSSKALVEVTGEKVKTPSGFIDGIMVDGKFIHNALLTYIDGRCLLSEFFDPDLLVFGDPEFWLNEDYWENYENHIKDEYVDIYTVFSFAESNEHRNVGTLIHLTDSSTRNDNLFYKLAKLEPHFQSENRLSSKKASIFKSESAIVCNPFLNKDPIVVYGDEFTKDIFMKIFYDLFDPYKRTAKQSTQTLAMKFLTYLNGMSYGSNFEKFSQGPGVNEINTALKKLGFTKAELQALIWKKVNPKTGELEFNFDQTNKEWLKLLYDKITDYSTDDGSIYAQQRDKLKGLGSRYHKIDDTSITRNREKFTIEEAKMAIEIFESAKIIFGHFTIRLMFANMIDYYGSVGSFGIKILNRPSLQDKGQSSRMEGDIPPLGERNYLRDFLLKIGLIPSTFQYDKPVSALASMSSKSGAISTVTYLFGFFYLESHIYLNIENSHNIKSSDNMLTFPLGPLIALSALGSFGGKNLRDLSKGIGVYLRTSYETYRSDNLDPRNINILGKEFLADQSRTLDFLAKKIRSTIIEGRYYKYNKKNVWLANQLIESARLGLIHEGKSSVISGYLRDQLESFMEVAKDESNLNSLMLKFNYLMPGSKKYFRLEITQKELVENRLISWGKRNQFDSAEYAIFKAQLLHQNSHNIRKYLTYIINAMVTSKRVRIFPLSDTGDSNIGYEFIRGSRRYDRSILPIEETYIDIDLNNEESMYKLQHIINLLYTGKFAFVVKGATGTWEDGEMIFAFNREGFLEPSEIFSSNMVINGYSAKFIGDNNKWRKLWIYPKAWSINKLSQNNDLDSYLNYIINSKLEKKFINSFIREYMTRMELLFPKYLKFIKGYLGI